MCKLSTYVQIQIFQLRCKGQSIYDVTEIVREGAKQVYFMCDVKDSFSNGTVYKLCFRSFSV